MQQEPVSVTIVVTPKVSLISVLLVLEPFRAANRLSGRALFGITVASVDGEPVLASNGFEIPVEASIEQSADAALVVLAASYEQPPKVKSKLFSWLRRVARHGAKFFAFDHAVVFLAEAGLVENRRISVHWELMPSLQERWPEIRVAEDLYSFDGALMTCGGQTATLDMALAYLAEDFGDALARAVSNEMLSSGFRAGNTPQRHLSLTEEWSQHPKLKRAVELMKGNIETPLTIAKIADGIGLSKRQLENLSRQLLGHSPLAYYQQLRLRHARELLLYSPLSINEVASACGFSTISIFSRCFRREFATPPSAYRIRFQQSLVRPYLNRN